MKTAAKCVSACESQDCQMHRPVERTLRRRHYPVLSPLPDECQSNASGPKGPAHRPSIPVFSPGARLDSLRPSALGRSSAVYRGVSSLYKTSSLRTRHQREEGQESSASHGRWLWRRTRDCGYLTQGGCGPGTAEAFRRGTGYNAPATALEKPGRRRSVESEVPAGGAGPCRPLHCEWGRVCARSVWPCRGVVSRTLLRGTGTTQIT